MRFSFGVIGCALLLAACGSASERPAEEAKGGVTNETTPPAPFPPSSTPVAAEMRSCEAQLGTAAAQALADQCRAVSPATRPPCNVANSCAMIREEIERSCDLFADDPPAECGTQTDSQRAAGVVARYYEAIDARDYDTAYAMWSGDGEASGRRPADFAEGFATTRTSKVRITGPVTVDGGAGSLYAEIPVEVTATLDDGRSQRFTGTYVLRRVNDVDGATADQRRWHIASAKLRAG